MTITLTKVFASATIQVWCSKCQARSTGKVRDEYYPNAGGTVIGLRIMAKCPGCGQKRSYILSVKEETI